MGDEIRKGLEGVVADRSAVSRVDPETGTLTYRGYAVPELAEHCSFEEVAYLLWHGDLPTRAQLRAFTTAERHRRALPPDLVQVLRRCPVDAHPMDVLRTVVSFLGMAHGTSAGPGSGDAPDPAALRDAALDLLAKIPTAVAFFARARRGLGPIEPRADLSLAANAFWMTFGRVPHADIVKAFEVSLTLYAEHGFNASTFTARVVTSTRADLHGAVTAAVAALKGPLHGGANEAVMADLQAMGEPGNAEAWLAARLAAGHKVMGFGHRVYKEGDSRVPLAATWGRRVAVLVGDRRWHDRADALREAMAKAKGIFPNLDFETGPLYALMGFQSPEFTPIFVMGRVVGWAAHVMEQAADNRIIRPLSRYDGPATRRFVPLADRARRPVARPASRRAVALARDANEASTRSASHH